ncbi:MAG: tyrosine-type recombinase/integrase [Methylococcaceae bacterium]
MNSTIHIPPTTQRWLRNSPLTPYVIDYFDHLVQCRYAVETTEKYMAGIAHLGLWMGQSHLAIEQLDEKAVTRFLDEHLPTCDCPRPVFRTRSDLRAACAHLLHILRDRGVIPQPATPTFPLDAEVDCFAEYLCNVRGLAGDTCRNYRRIVRCLLEARFGTAEIVFPALQPADVRQFIANQLAHRATPAKAHQIASALRAYFRYRGACGDDVHALKGIIVLPAHWRLASLPRSLSDDEVDCLLNAFPPELPSCRRGYAMVRCALDLGLRVSEIAKLALTDIDWQAGTVTLRSTKSRRVDVLPLPIATGEAIADYLRYERPRTTNQAVFVRRLAPHDVPISPDAVHRLIRDAYQRIGLKHGRTHALRHTLARQLLDQGSSLKEVADILRHRSLDTSLIYAKLDSRRLSAVALPWPGSAT